MKYLRINRSWFINGFETFALGVLFLMTDNFIDRPPDIVTHIDEPYFSIPILLIGLYVMISCFGLLEGNKQVLVMFLPLVIWTFYFIMFFWHDLASPIFVPHFNTIFTFFIVIRILFEAFWSDYS